MNMTVENPEEAVFYLVCCGPLERLLALPPRSPERPYMCYDCDAILRLDFMRFPEACTMYLVNPKHGCQGAALVQSFEAPSLEMW